MELWRFLRGIPALAYAFAGGVALVAVLTTWHARTVEAAYQRGRSDVLQAAHFDSTLRAVVDSSRAKTKATVDTVFRSVRAAAAKVDSQAIAAAALASRIPETVRDPIVDSLKRALPVLVVSVAVLTAKVATLDSALKADSVATKVSIDVRDGLIRNARLENARQAATILALEKRPTRAQAVIVAVASAGVGVIGGKVWQ